jgi:outer membrane protein assembly factor BamB
MPVAKRCIKVRPRGVMFALAFCVNACASPTDAPLVPTPEAVLWKGPYSLGLPIGEIGTDLVFQTSLRVANSRGSTLPGATITVVDAATGSTRWQYSSDSLTSVHLPRGASPQSELYVHKGSRQNDSLHVAVLDAATGRLRWQAPTCGLTPARIGNTIVTLEGGYVPTPRAEFVGRDAGSGSELWRVDVMADSIACSRVRLLTVRSDTAIYLSNFGTTALQPAYSQQFIHVAKSGARRLFPAPSSLRRNYTFDLNSVDVRLLDGQSAILIRDSTRLNAVDFTDGRLLWTRDPRPTDVSQRSILGLAYSAIATAGNALVVTARDTLGYDSWRATLDARTGSVISEVRPPSRDDFNVLRQCGGTRLLGWDANRRLLLLDGVTGHIVRRLSVTLTSTGNMTVRPNSVYVTTSTHNGRYGLVVDMLFDDSAKEWMAFQCD